jgi:hypothetical protein
MDDATLRQTLEPLVSRNTGIFTVLGGIGAVACAGLTVVLAVMPAKPDELGIKIGMVCFMLFSFFASIAFALWGRGQGHKVRHLAMEHPELIQRMEIHTVRSGAMVTTALRLFDARGRFVALNVPNAEVAQHIGRALQARGAKAG